MVVLARGPGPLWGRLSESVRAGSVAGVSNTTITHVRPGCVFSNDRCRLQQQQPAAARVRWPANPATAAHHNWNVALQGSDSHAVSASGAGLVPGP